MKLKTFVLFAMFCSTAALAEPIVVCNGENSISHTTTVSLRTVYMGIGIKKIAQVILASNVPTAMPLQYTFTVVETENRDSDSDVSTKYRDTNPSGKFRLKVSENPAMGQSYVTGIPNHKKIALSCKVTDKL